MTRKQARRKTTLDGKPKASGRPSKFTPQVCQQILDAVRAGNYLETCAAYAGISYVTMNDWIKRGEVIQAGLPDDDEMQATAISNLSEIELEFLEFSASVKSERAKAEMQALMEIRQAAQGTAERGPIWQAHAWFLERSHPTRWGRQHVTKEISGPGGKPIAFKDETPTLTDADRLDRVRKLLRQEVPA